MGPFVWETAQHAQLRKVFAPLRAALRSEGPFSLPRHEALNARAACLSLVTPTPRPR